MPLEMLKFLGCPANDSQIATNLLTRIEIRLFLRATNVTQDTMYWTLELASYLEDAPWPATKDELIDFSMRTGAPLEVVENLQQLEDDGESFDTIEDIWPDYPSKEDFFFNEDEY